MKVVSVGSGMMGANVVHGAMSMSNLDSRPSDYYSLSRAEMMNYVPSDARRLIEFGCGYGNFSELATRERQLECWGIEVEPEAAKCAAHKIHKVLCGDAAELLQELPDSYFDCAVFNDILEHMADPYTLLLKVKAKLSPAGVVVASIPNVRYWRNLKRLVFRGEWTYTDKGILDRSHLRFFTKKSIISMFDEAGYSIIRIDGIKPTRSRSFRVANLIALGSLSDAKFCQFACLARPLDSEKKSDG